MESSDGVVHKIPRRRSETRARLISAALEILKNESLSSVSIEHLCEAAGYTRGAFYSNFSSIYELTLALYEQQQSIYVHELEKVVDGADYEAPVANFKTVVTEIVSYMPVSATWHLLGSELTAQAIRNPDAAQDFVVLRRSLRKQLIPIVERAIQRSGRRATVPMDELMRLVMAAHDGALAHGLFNEPGEPESRARELSAQTLEVVFAALTESVLPES